MVWADRGALASGGCTEIRGNQGRWMPLLFLHLFLPQIASTFLLTMTCVPQINLD